MPNETKMVKLQIEETSGVDHPAHMQEGWIVMKSSGEQIREAFDSLTSDEEVVVMEHDTPQVDESVEKEMTMDEAMKKIYDLEKKISEMQKSVEETVETVEDTEADMIKALPEPVRNMLDEMQKAADLSKARAEELEKSLEDARVRQADVEAADVVKSWSNLTIDADEFGPSLRKLRDLDGDLAATVETILESANERAEAADLFTEIGKSAAPNTGSAYDKMTSLAKARFESGTAATIEQAMAEVAIENPAVYGDYITEKGA